MEFQVKKVREEAGKWVKKDMWSGKKVILEITRYAKYDTCNSALLQILLL